ncbi:MAG: sigma-54-dependent Fis family transcriptional regulator [Bryobacteraceae bacterium]|nr:sigma-54-dependent Fis family transcriptional regulator [Bryobacteraceae bacterium]
MSSPEPVLVSDHMAATGTKGRILVVDDEVDIRESLETLLDLEGYSVELAVDAGDAWRKLGKSKYDLVLLDLMMPDRSGMDLLHDIRGRDTETPVIMLTAYGSVEVAVQALKNGANDYFPKPWDNDKLIIEIGNLIARDRLQQENLHLKRALKQRYSFGNIIGKNERMLKVLDLVGTVASSRSTILLTGETGTGKEVIAKAIHANSPRADNAFVAVNSGSLPQDLLESTLFGHVKGAFTSAYASQKGYFEIANGGTIFFDEIGNVGHETQARLLRVIQEREFMPLGSPEMIRVDVRIIAATNADLRKLVEDGRFREDLYYRLNVINIALPPLRDRKSDIPLLIEYFFQKYCEENTKLLDSNGKTMLAFSPDALHLLMDHSWPGNVRELENAVERAVVLATDPVVPVDVLPDHVLHAGGMRIRRDESGKLPADASLFEKVADFERRQIIEALEAATWSQTDAAEALRIPLSTLNQKIKRLEIQIKRRGQQGG